MSSFTLLELYRNVLHMMEVRGYNVSSYLSVLNRMSAEAFVRLYSQSPTDFAAHIEATIPGALPSQLRTFFTDESIIGKDVNPRTNMILLLSRPSQSEEKKDAPPDYAILYFAEPQLKKGAKEIGKTGKADFIAVLRYLEWFRENVAEPKTLVIITKTPVSEASSHVKDLLLDVELFTDDEFTFNPIQHVYNSQARILSPGETDIFLKSNNLTPAMMPRIPANEPVAKYLGAQPGEIIEFTRTSFIPEMLVDEEPFYRAVRRPIDKKRKSVRRAA